MNKQLKRRLGIVAVVAGLAAPLAASAEHRDNDGNWALRAVIGSYVYADGDRDWRYGRHNRRHASVHRRQHRRTARTHSRWHWRNEWRRDWFYPGDHYSFHHNRQHRHSDFHHEQRQHRF